MDDSKKAIGIFGIATIVVLSVLVLAIAPVSAATIHYVNPGDKIQDKINAASDGDTIIVRNGTYTENVVVNKSLTIRSEYGALSTTVEANDTNLSVFRVINDSVNITGFTVRNTNSFIFFYYGGIHLDSVDYCTISENIVLNNLYGILLRSSSNNTITNNTASDNWYGITLEYLCNNNNLTGNTLTGNPDIIIHGIGLTDECNNNTLTGNTVSNHSGSGISLANWCNDNTITGNNASKNSVGIDLANECNDNNLTGNIVLNNSYYGIGLLYLCNNNNISCNWVHHNTRYGFYLTSWFVGSNIGNTIENNNVIANGIYNGTNGGYEYNFYNNQTENVTAEDNYWGTTSSAVIAASIYQDPGLVDYEPFLTAPAPCAPFEAPIVPEVSEVPTLTPTGLIALVSLLSVIAAVAIVRKRR